MSLTLPNQNLKPQTFLSFDFRLKKNKIPAQCRARLIIKTYGSQKKNCKCRRHPTKFLLRTFCKKCMFILRSTSKLRTRLTPRCRLSRHSTSVTQPRSYVALSERLKNCKPHLRKNVAYEAGSLLQEESRISERYYAQSKTAFFIYL